MKLETMLGLGVLGVVGFFVVTNWKAISNVFAGLGEGIGGVGEYVMGTPASITIDTTTSPYTGPAPQSAQPWTQQQPIIVYIGPDKPGTPEGTTLIGPQPGQDIERKTSVSTPSQPNIIERLLGAQTQGGHVTVGVQPGGTIIVGGKQYVWTPEQGTTIAAATTPPMQAYQSAAVYNNAATPAAAPLPVALVGNPSGTASNFNPSLGEYAWAQPGSPKYQEGVAKGVIK